MARAGVALVAAGLSLPAWAFFCRQDLIPNNPTEPVGQTCGFCHLFPTGGGPRTPFGQDMDPLADACEEFWGPALAALDSDGDGFTNGEELQDPEGLWQPGQPDPGDPALVSNPGDPASTPPVTPTPTYTPTPTPPSPDPADLNQDGRVDKTDLFIFAVIWYEQAGERQQVR